MLRRRREVLQEGYNCVMCHLGAEETIEHLFFDCPSTTSRWFAVGIGWEDNLSVHLLTVYFGAPSMFITLWFGFDYGTNPSLGTLII
jgi:hypothetical protein